MVLKWGLDRLSRPCFVQYNIDIEYFSGDISDSAAAKRVEILRWSVYRCPSLYKHRKRCKKRLDFTPFRSKMRFRVKYAGFYRESCGSMESRGRSRVMATQMRLLNICVAGPPCRRPPLPRQMAQEHSLCHIVVACYGRIWPLTFRKISPRVIFISLFCLHLSFMVPGFPAI